MISMFKRCACVVTMCAVFAMNAVLVNTTCAAPPIDVKVQINDHLIQFPDAEPFIDDNAKLLVPIRFISEHLGYQLHWELAGEDVKVQLSKDEQTIHLKTGQSNAIVNQAHIDLDTEPLLLDGRVYVPLRFMSETNQIRVQWDRHNNIAILNEDGQYHAPAWYAPLYEEPVTFEATAYSTSVEENSPYGARDYMGNPLQLGTIAVDPKVIPLGSTVYIEGYHYDGLPSGGMFAKATDIGGAVKGNRLDIFIPESREQLKYFGIQKVKVYRLKEDK